jgi:hypothetical protein
MANIICIFLLIIHAQITINDFPWGEYKDWSTHGTWYSLSLSEYHVTWVDQSLYSPKLKFTNCFIMTLNQIWINTVFSDWLTSLVTFFDKMLYSTRKKSWEVNITFQRFSRHLKIEMVFPGYLKSSSQSSSG